MRSKAITSSLLLTGLLGLCCALPTYAADKMGRVNIRLPDETAKYLPGPGEKTANNNCRTCHSVDYVYMQPPLSREKWHAEVMKMKKVYGAQIDDKNVDAIVNYLMSQNGKK